MNHYAIHYLQVLKINLLFKSHWLICFKSFDELSMSGF